MEPSEYSSFFVASEVTSSGCKFMGTSLHQGSDGLAFEPQADRSHLCNRVATVDHVLTPILHGVFELGEVLRNLILSNILHDVAYVIEVSPFGVVGRR